MDQNMLKSEIDVLNGEIKSETEAYYLAITRKKDFMVARNIKLRINLLHKNLHTRMQMLSDMPEMK